MKHIFRNIIAATMAVFALSTGVMAAPNVTDIDNSVYLGLKDVDNSIITQVVTNVNLVNNIDIDIDLSGAKKPEKSISTVRDVMEYSRRLRAGLTDR